MLGFQVYVRCQEMENKRLEFFKERLLAMEQSLDLSNDVVLKQISADYLATINNADARADLKWWDMQRGVDMPMSWPQFEVRKRLDFSRHSGFVTNLKIHLTLSGRSGHQHSETSPKNPNLRFVVMLEDLRSVEKSGHQKLTRARR